MDLKYLVFFVASIIALLLLGCTEKPQDKQENNAVSNENEVALDSAFIDLHQIEN